ncbi:MAG: type II secretion system F family protein [Candidatus Micrarchaeaceae archaeon]
MQKITFERLVSRGVVRYISGELDLAGVKISLDRFMQIAIIGFFALFVITPVVLELVYHFSNLLLAGLAGLVVGVVFEVAIYVILEFKIEKRKNFIESILPDYLQLVAANIRSGVSLDRAILLAKRPEFSYLTYDIDVLNKQLYSGETMQNALLNLASRYRSAQLMHTVRMIIEAVRYGGTLADLLNQIAKDIRVQQTIQKEISGQLFMYTIFITFAAVIASPALYGLTFQMITITDKIWSGILQQNPGGLPSTGVSFLKPSPPQISPGDYFYFAIAAIIITTSLSSFTIAAITSGEPIRGIRFLPAFLFAGIAIFFVVKTVIGGVFGSLGGI